VAVGWLRIAGPAGNVANLQFLEMEHAPAR
jgi:hypothetical protein